MIFLRSWLLTLLLLSLSLLPVHAGRDKAAVPVRAVIELFTSQGCNSCPPADRILGEYAKKADIVALTLPVTIWDYGPWKDTLAKYAFTERQRNYAFTSGDRRFYTPQVVVNGKYHAIGNRRDDVSRALRTAAIDPATVGVPIKVQQDGNAIRIQLGSSAKNSKPGKAKIWMAIVKREVSVDISHGENAGKRLTYYNVVTDLIAIGDWSGEVTTLKHVMDGRPAGDELCAILVQRDDAGPIVAAAWMSR